MEREELRRLAMGWDGLAEEYHERLGDELSYKPRDRELLADFAAMAADIDAPVLDLGCGPGHITHHLASSGLRVRGLDLSPTMIDVARTHYPDLDFAVGDLLDLELAPESFGGAVALYSLIHLAPDDVPRVLEEVAAALVAGAPLLLAVHAGEGTLTADQVFGRAVPMAVTLFDADELATMVTTAGFEVLVAETRPPYPAEGGNDRVYVLARHWPATPAL